MSKRSMQSCGSASSLHEETPSQKVIEKMNIKYENAGVSGQFKDFLKTVVTFTGDLSALTCPTFFLNGQSLLEYSTYWGDHPELFAAIAEPTDPAARMLAVTRWYMSTLYGSYASRCDKGQSEKKPYNPVLGEKFLCTFDDVNGTGETVCICEQVSHHPPSSAFYLENKKAGVSVNGHCGQKSKFKGTSIKVEQIGRATLHLLHPSETYIVTFPDLYIRSLFTGSPFLELSGTSSIVSSTGCVASLEFVSKPWFKGEHHHIKGSVCNAAGKETHTITGRWNSVTHFTAVGSGKQQLLFDAEASPMAARVTAPVEQQDRLETHRLWGGVTAALRERNYSAANAEKNRIEEGQRLEKKEREMKGETWAPALFAFEADKESENEEEARMRKQAKATSSVGGGLDIGGWLYKESMHLKQ